MMQASIPTEAGKGAAAKSAPPTQEELAVAFPQLEILELIGQGGMGYVFKARQPKIERLVALKILPQSLAADPAFAERFTREGRMLARLNHPNIVTLHDFGQAGGFFYLLMEFVDGVNLRQAMKVGRFTPAQALSIVPKICEALQFAHNEGILHRDIKPENILLDSRGRVKIADFGIAKLVGGEDSPPGQPGTAPSAPPANLTETGKVLGTPQYMAPEQIEHPQDVDQRADIYSLGVVFYEMLTGELPLGRFAPPSEKSTVDPRVDEVVLRTLEKERERRTQTAGEVRTQVETITGTPELGRSRRGEARSASTRPNPEWGKRMPLLSPLQSPEVRDICAHLTKAESNRVALLGLLIGVWVVAAVFGIPFLIKSFPSPGNWIVGSVFGMIFFITLPMLSSIGRQFLCSTAWAKEQGFAPEHLNLFSLRANNLWKGLAVLLVLLSLVLLQHEAFIRYLGLSDLHYQAQNQTVPAPQKRTKPQPVFGPVVERTINRASTGTNFLLNFKTGDLRTPPPEKDGQAVEVHGWARRQGLDAAVGILNGDNDVMTGFDMVVLPVPDQCWEELKPAEAAVRLEGQPASSFVILFHANGSFPETCVFRTRDGGIGILQLTGYVSEPPGVKIRYKFVDKVPATAQTQSNTVATEAWAPNLLPGEKPDLRKILEEANNLTATDHFEEALQRDLWYHGHAQEFGGSASDYSLLSQWVELGRRYPKAKQALVNIRDKDTREITEGRGYAEIFHEVQAINGELQDDDATYALFNTVRDSDPMLADQCFYYLQDLLVAKGEYQWCLKHLGDPQERFDSIRRGLDMDRDNQKRMAETRQRTAQQMADMNQKSGRTNTWSSYDPSAMMKKSSEDRFVGQTRQLIEILVGTGHKADAEEIRNQAVAILDDPRLKSAVSDAAEKIKKQSIPANGN
jgi:serine/threonine protein kinase